MATASRFSSRGPFTVRFQVGNNSTPALSVLLSGEGGVGGVGGAGTKEDGITSNDSPQAGRLRYGKTVGLVCSWVSFGARSTCLKTPARWRYEIESDFETSVTARVAIPPRCHGRT